jgi:monoterpene epsilon-lactone hydrolase
MAGFGKFKVVSIDYRMPPDFPYPACDPNAPETKEHFSELTAFFDKYLAK